MNARTDELLPDEAAAIEDKTCVPCRAELVGVGLAYIRCSRSLQKKTGHRRMSAANRLDTLRSHVCNATVVCSPPPSCWPRPIDPSAKKTKSVPVAARFFLFFFVSCFLCALSHGAPSFRRQRIVYHTGTHRDHRCGFHRMPRLRRSPEFNVEHILLQNVDRTTLKFVFGKPFVVFFRSFVSFLYSIFFFDCQPRYFTLSVNQIGAEETEQIVLLFSSENIYYFFFKPFLCASALDTDFSTKRKTNKRQI